MRYLANVRPLLAGLLVMGASAACQRASVDITGHVLDQNGRAIANAQVCANYSGQCVASKADGTFSLGYTGTPGKLFGLAVAADGYARQGQPLSPKQGASLYFFLRKVGSVTPVTLAPAGGTAVSANVTVNSNTMVLTIPGGAMVDPNGKVATGPATISLTYWNPLEQIYSGPAPLLSEDPNNGVAGPIPLATLGMGDIEVVQNGVLLQVASGQHLAWQMPVPPSLQPALTASGARMPNLYSMNPNSGLWKYEGDTASGALSYDANQAVFTAQLPHLSAWNIDFDAPPSGGGCVTGQAVTTTGAPAANTAITIWFMSFEELKDWHTTTDASGNYCMATPVTSIGGADSTQTVNYFVSGSTPSQTDMCNPVTPSSCFDCTMENASAAYGWCSLCRLTSVDPGNFVSPDGTVTVAPTFYENTCGAPSANIVAGTFCPTGCTTLNKVTLDPNGGVAAVPPPPPPPCSGQNSNYNVITAQGQSCTPAPGKASNGRTDICCPETGSGALVCADYLCLPPAD